MTKVRLLKVLVATATIALAAPGVLLGQKVGQRATIQHGVVRNWLGAR